MGGELGTEARSKTGGGAMERRPHPSSRRYPCPDEESDDAHARKADLLPLDLKEDENALLMAPLSDDKRAL
jgi:hypothetical protein